MTNYWESKFLNGGAVWGYEPSESAMISAEEFKKKGLNNILIPGFGYGRNARHFIEKGFNITGIEISGSAINVARANRIDCTIHHGSVTSMPFDGKVYDAVFCYALIHLLNKRERKHFLNSCYSQIKINGLMIFIVTSKVTELYGKGKYLSKDRFEIEPGLKVYFYDSDSIIREFSPFGLVEYREIKEPVKFMKGVEPLSLYFVVCRKGELM